MLFVVRWDSIFVSLLARVSLQCLSHRGVGLGSKIESPAQFLRPLGGALALAFLLGPSAASAQVDWANATSVGAYYQTPANWSGGAVPATGNGQASFDLGSTYEVWWDVSTPSGVGTLEVGQGDVTFLNKDSVAQYLYTINGTNLRTVFSIAGASTSATISGLHFKSLGGGQIVSGATLTLDGSHAQGSQLTMAGSSGFDVSGNLNVNAGGLVSNGLGFIGYSSGLTGTATVTGSGSAWNNTSNLLVGRYGTGTLKVEDAGVVTNSLGFLGYYSSGSGTATVTGSGSSWSSSGNFLVGRYGAGTLKVEDGGVVSNNVGWLGYYNIGSGAATVSGSGSAWNNSSSLSVGRAGAGTLTVEAGGQVSNTTGYIGSASGGTGTATVTGNGSAWNNSSSLYVGSDGIGILNIEDGGAVSSTNGYIVDSNNSFSTGTVTVVGSASSWNISSNIYVGYTGTGLGTLRVEGGSVVSNTEAYIGYGQTSGFPGFPSTGIATVTGSGSRWNSRGDIVVGRLGSGTLNLEDGGVVNNGTGILATDSGLTGTATVTGSGSQWNNREELFVGLGGTGMLSLEAGGVVNNTNAYIGLEAFSKGTATVTGSGSVWNNSGSLYVGIAVGVSGGGTLTMADGGLVDVTGTTKLWSSGTLTLNGGSLTTGSLDNTAGGAFVFTTGTLGITDASQALTTGASNFSLTNGTTFNTEGDTTTLATDQNLEIAGSSVIGSGGSLALDGGSLTTGSLDNDGTLSIKSGGTLTVDGLASGGGAGEIIQTAMDSVVRFLGGGSMANDMSVFGYSFGDDFTSSGAFTMMHEDSSVTVDSGATVSGSGGWGGTGGLTKKGAGQLTLTGSNSFSGGLTVEAGIVELAAVSGSAAGAVSGVSVSSGATLLLGESHQVADAAAITLSGGTLSRSSGVSDTMGGLSLTAASTIDYGSGSTGTLAFGAYESGSTPDFVLTVNNFAGGNVLSLDSDLSGYLPVSYEGSAYSSTYFDINSTGGFTSAWDTNSSTFSITAVPEPSTYLAGGLLLLLMGGSVLRRRLAKVRG